MKTVGWMILLILAVFLMLDSILAMVFGKRYVLLGLNHMPGFYRTVIEKISRLPQHALILIKLAELAAGFILFLIVQLMQRESI